MTGHSMGTNSNAHFFHISYSRAYWERKHSNAGLPSRGGGWGFSLATMNAVPSYFHRKIDRKKKQKEGNSLAV